METQVFNDALSRPRFAVLKFLAETGQYKSFECFLCPGVSVLVLLYLLIWVLSTSELLGCVVFRHVGCESPVCFICCKVSSFVFCWARSELVVRAGVGCFPSRVIVSGCRTLTTWLSLPPDFEVLAVLKLRLGESKPVDKARFQVLFGQYFRFDVVSQKPFFYKEVQNFLRTVCEACIGDYDQGWVKHLSLLPLGPYAIQSVSMDRLTDILWVRFLSSVLEIYAEGDHGAIILQQYREVVNYFKRRWELLRESLGVQCQLLTMPCLCGCHIIRGTGAKNSGALWRFFLWECSMIRMLLIFKM